jgi:8-oxo-dGTP pyrophosphatase MutT (NUDIX family)
MIKKNVVGLVLKNKKILLQLRDNKKNIIFPNKWGFFGGEVNVNEDHFLAIKRELYEELNINNFQSLKFINHHFEPKYNCMFYIYKISLAENITLKEGADCDFFFEYQILKGKKSKKSNIFHDAAEVQLMNKIFKISKKFL